MKTTSVTVMVFFSKVPFWNYLIKPRSQFSHNNYKTLWQRQFEAIDYSWKFYRHGSPYELIFSWVNIFKRKSVKVPGLSSSLLFEKHSTKTFTISLIIVFSFFSQINLVYKISYFVVPMIFATVFFFFYFLIFCVFWS